MSTQTVAEVALAHILEQYLLWIESKNGKSPLFVAIQGPQGIGKTYLTKQLVNALESRRIRTEGFSIDDFYLGHDELVNVAATNQGNLLLQGRGLPGTHDIELGVEILEKLSTINDGDFSIVDQGTESLRIPVFDKSLHDGRGDRLPITQWRIVDGPIDVVIVEGWCMGFYPITEEDLVQRWSHRAELNFPDSLELTNGVEDLRTINRNLESFADKWYPFFHCLIQISPHMKDYNIVYSWRLQQEHTMKAANGGKGMTDEEVKNFIDRYIPCYLFFGGGVKLGHVSNNGLASRPPWATRSLQIKVDENRKPISTDDF